jgi:hypothetical protein
MGVESATTRHIPSDCYDTTFLYLDGELLAELTRTEVSVAGGKLTVRGRMLLGVYNDEADLLIRKAESHEPVTMNALLAGKGHGWTANGKIDDATMKGGVGMESELEFTFIGHIEGGAS